MHCIQIVPRLPAPVNFLSDAVALASNYVRPPQATARFRLAWFAVRTKALRLRVIEVSVQKFLECLDYRSLAKVGRIERGSQPVFSLVVRVVNVEAHGIHPLALVGFKPGDDQVTLWVDIGRLPAVRENRNEKEVKRAESF
jgi:hypothetical protein